MAKKNKFTEEELAAAAEKYFQSRGWTTYPEVVIPNFGGRADIVGTKQGLCMVAECKVSFSYTVLEQLTRWRHEMAQWIESDYADESVKGIPHLLLAVVGGGSVGNLKKEILDSHRIGLITAEVSRGWGEFAEVTEGRFDMYGRGSVNGDVWRFYEGIPAKIQYGSRKTAHKIIEHLDPDMRCGTAGASGKKGGYMTPFRRTINKAESVLAQGGDWHIARIVDEINANHGGHHYANDNSAKNSIAQFLERFGIAERVDEYRPVFRLATTSSEV